MAMKCFLTETVVLLLATLIYVGYAFEVTLEELSTLYLPYEYTPTPNFALGEDASEQIAYDKDRKMLYSVGNNNIHVISMSDVTNLTLLHHTSVDGFVITDIEYCGGFIFVALDNRVDKEEGMVKVYRVYNEATGELQLLHNITVGAVPDMLHPTHDCRKVLVAVEAEPYDNAGTPVDPEGAVALIKFQDSPAESYNLKILDFRNFNDQVENLERDGVRFVFRGINNTFANDIEPEFIAFNDDETKAYVTLQENNAIGIVDMEREEVTSIHGLGFKDWSRSNVQLDPSDREGGINLRSWPVFGMYQPDAIKFLRIRNHDYIFLANEGDSKDYSFFSEEDRVADVTISSNFEMNATRRAEFQQEEQLGRLKITTENGKNPTTGEYDALYSFGGRSFSIRRADDMSLVYDSGGDISYQTSRLHPDLFNNDIDGDMAVSATTDTRSDDKGPETESLEIAEFGDYILIIAGNERPGTLSLFSIDKTKSVIKPKFEGMYHGIPRADATWQTLYDNREVWMLDPEDLRYIPAGDSPNNKPLLVATGSVSGTVTILQINVKGATKSTSSAPKVGRKSSISPYVFLILLLFLKTFMMI